MVKCKEYEQAFRDLVIKHHKNGKKQSQIIECLAGQVSKPTVSRWISELNTTGIEINIYSIFLFILFY